MAKGAGGAQPPDARLGSVAGFADAVRAGVESVIIGKTQAVDLLTVALLSQGHVLIEDVPGTGKTMLARAFAGTLGVDFHRLQCTPDLLPTEVTGVNVFDQGSGGFEFRPGSVFSNVLLVDEINRATPRTQSALLEAMAERQVSVEGVTRELPEPFLVLATQNPVEHAGTFPLPEAQLDRFLLRVEVGYPEGDDEVAVLLATQRGHPIDQVQPAVAGADLQRLWQEVRAVYAERSVLDWIVALARGTRAHEGVELGASVRGSMALLRAGQARAAMHGRDYLLPEDVLEVAVPVLAHRVMVTSHRQLQGVSAADVVREVIDSVAVPIDLPDG